MEKTSFQRDIVPLFERWRDQMIWRCDLTSYDHVKGNAESIKKRIDTSDPGAVMPPPPYPALTSEQVQLFERWMGEGYPP